MTHQSFSHLGRTYIAPYKAVELDRQGTLRMKFWPVNVGLKGDYIAVKKHGGGGEAGGGEKETRMERGEPDRAPLPGRWGSGE